MPRTSRLDSLAYAAAILFLPTLAGVVGGEIAKGTNGIAIWDKAVHFSAYFILSFLAVTALKARQRAFWAAFSLVALGGVLEIVQGFIGRDCDIHDEIANSLGVFTGTFLAWCLVKLVDRKPPA